MNAGVDADGVGAVLRLRLAEYGVRLALKSPKTNV
jgi:hypothetical protein